MVVYAVNRCGAVRTIALLRVGEPPLKEADLCIDPDPRLLLEAVKALGSQG